jgi:ketosteroid isomerase-like protein
MKAADLANRFYESLSVGDMTSAMGLLDAEVEWLDPEGWPYPQRSIGPEQVMSNIFMRIAADWADFRIDVQEMIDADDRAVAFGMYTGISKATGRSMRAAFSHRWQAKDSKIVRFLVCADTLKFREPLTKV